MKTLSKFLLLIFLTITIATVYAQEPVPILDTLKNPVKQGDPEVETTPPDANYRYGLVKIPITNLPERVKRTLQSDSKYSGWQKAATYKDKDGRNYVVEFQQGDRTRVFKFDKNGKLLLD